MVTQEQINFILQAKVVKFSDIKNEGMYQLTRAVEAWEERKNNMDYRTNDGKRIFLQTKYLYNRAKSLDRIIQKWRTDATTQRSHSHVQA